MGEALLGAAIDGCISCCCPGYDFDKTHGHLVIGTQIETNSLQELFSHSDLEKIKTITIEEGVRRIKDGSGPMIYNGVPRDTSGVFMGLENLTSIEIPDSVTSIGENAFTNTGLKEVKIPYSIYGFDQAFRGCKNLEKIEFPNKLRIISSYAFQGCTNLKEIYIPDSVTGIGAGAFQGCTNLKELFISSGISSISGKISYEQWVDDKLIGLKIEAPSPFQDCTSLEKVNLPDDFRVLGACAFMGCTSLKSIDIPDGTFVGQMAFRNCTSLKKVKISFDYSKISPFTFMGCTNLETVDIQNKSLDEICEGAFCGCESLKKIYTEYYNIYWAEGI